MQDAQNKHEASKVRSYRILQAARDKATKENGYNSQAARTQFIDAFRDRMSLNPYPWQVDATEAVTLGLDTVVIAGTGAGKTMPFVMPLLVDKRKQSIVISPLKALQADHADRFKKLNVSAVAVNGDTWNDTLREELNASVHQGILVGPEMCLQHAGFRRMLTDGNFQNICAVYVDETHCIGQWGGEFRPAYSELNKLRAFFPPHIPIYATSATLTESTLREARTSLGIDIANSFFLNLGNDRPNISYEVHHMDSAHDYNSLKPYISRKPKPRRSTDLIKTIIFTNTVSSTQLIAKRIRKWLPHHLRSSVDYISSRRTPSARRRVMRHFRQGKVKTLIATEIAGMGMDIPDIVQVIQFGIPGSLTVWIQRAGRAGRASSIMARAILLVEKSMFERQRKKKRHKDSDLAPEEEGGQNEEGDGEDGEAGEDKGDDEEFEWRKKVEEALRRWIETEECRRIIVDEHFGNPPRQPPTGVCCDNCNRAHDNAPESQSQPSTPVAALIAVDPPKTPTRTLTPSICGTASPIHLTPSKSTNANGKRPLVPSARPAARRGDRLKHARQSLLTWRSKTLLTQQPSPFTDEAFMPFSVIKTLASSAWIQTIVDMKAAAIGWALVDEHGEEVLDILWKVDHNHEEDKRRKAAERSAATAARNAERKRQDVEERAAKRLAKEIEKKQVANENVQLERETGKTAKRTKKPRKVLAGTTVINFKAASVTPTATPVVQPVLSGTSVINLSSLSASPKLSLASQPEPMTPFIFEFTLGTQPPTASNPTCRSRKRKAPSPQSTPQRQRRRQRQYIEPVSHDPPTPMGLPKPRPRPRPRPVHKSHAQSQPLTEPSTIPLSPVRLFSESVLPPSEPVLSSLPYTPGPHLSIVDRLNVL